MGVPRPSARTWKIAKSKQLGACICGRNVRAKGIHNVRVRWPADRVKSG